MSSADDTTPTLPVKREDDDSIEETLTDNAYENILPARYLKKNRDGEIIEDQEEIFSRVAKNIALAEAVFEAQKADIDITVKPEQIKPDHPRRDELITDVFGQQADESATATLTEGNVNKFAYDTLVPELPDTVRRRVQLANEQFRHLMESLSFMPNSPTIMNAGDELQQLSACFVDSPDDDITDIHETAREAAEIFQSGGGVGYAFWKLRPYGDAVGSTGGIASGPITFMRTYDQLCETIAQGGARRGAQMGVMRISHPDIIQFIHAKNKDVSLANTLRLNDPDDFTHTSFNDALDEARELIDSEGHVPKHLRNAVEGHLSNFNISVGITDGFMEALENDAEFTFTNPRTGEPHIATHETKELYERFGLGEYVKVDEQLSLPAHELWDDIIAGAHENGEPGVIYLERINDQHSFDVEKHPDHQILATNPCLTGDMDVILEDGTETAISQLAAQDGEISVRTLGDNGVESATADAFKTGHDKPIVSITLSDETTLKATPDHEIHTPDGWVEAAELIPGDEVLVLGKQIATPHGTRQDVATRTVSAIEPAGTADVYDLSVNRTHNFFASAPGTTPVNVHNCGEQPLEEYEACNLGHINLSTLVATDANYQDFRVFRTQHADSNVQLAEIVEDFLDQAIDWEEFNKRIRLGTRFLDNVVTMSDFPVEEIEQTVREMRKVGLGIMGLAQLFIQLGLKYGSQPANEATRQLMMHINHESKRISHNLAEERGSFAQWSESKYADPTAYTEWFEHHVGVSAGEFEGGFPIRNHNTTTIAPTGSTSMLGNTSGGCEPLYNVAYYKNVSDDVQGDEMLVEFDDYFLRTLEANDVNVEAVKEEAEDQMAANEFDGVEGLSTVPDEIGELFVVTSDLSGKEHAAVQCAAQKGVDSAISKTCNFPHEATADDMDEVYRYIYKNGGKGVTVYRDGTRSKQVLTTRAQNTEFADEAEAAETLIKQITDVFGDIESFLTNEDVQEVLNTEIENILDTAEAPETAYAERRPRPDALNGVTQRIETGYGKMYVTINEDNDGHPFELFANIGHSGGYTNSFTESLAKIVSTAFRSGVSPVEVRDELVGTRSPKIAYDRGDKIQSIPDAIGTAIDRYLNENIDSSHTGSQQRLEEVTKESPADTHDSTASQLTAQTRETDAEDTAQTQALISSGESPECPECGAMNLYYSEGCKTCEQCGWSEC
jgi:ribonucleotide reductase alpha subunit